MKFYIVILSIFLLSIACNSDHKNTPYFQVSNGTIHHIEKFQSKLVSPRNVEVWLPDSYNKNEKYAVLYMHDGQALFDSIKTWNKQEWGVDEVMGKLLKEGKIRNCIVVGIWNSDKGRHADYFPQKPFESLPEELQDEYLNVVHNNTPLFLNNSVVSDNYLRFMVEELKPYIDTHYATEKDKSNTFIAGSSMGGLISMYAICEYPQVFGGAACLSTHWPGIIPEKNNPIPEVFFDYINNHLPNPSTHKLYFDYGTKTLDSIYEPYQLEVDSIMKTKGFNESNWQTKKFIGENHTEKSWHKRLHIPLLFLLKKDIENGK